MARKNNRGALPPVMPLVDEQEENTIYDSDFTPSSDEPESVHEARQDSRFSFRQQSKVAGPTKHPYAMTLGNNKPKKTAKINCLLRQNQNNKDSDSIVEKAKTQRKLKFHELQNEIQSLKTKQKDLENENKLLKRTQRRQAAALKRYEGNEGELPSLIRSHQEEVRTLRELLKKSTEKQRLSEKRESDKAIELEKARIQLQRLQGIVREQHLDERIALNKKVDFLQSDLQEKEKKIREMQHHLDLRDKNYKHQLAIEFARHKDTKKKLNELQIRADKLSVTLKEKERELEIRNIYTAHFGNKSPRKPRSLSPNRKITSEFKDLKKLPDANPLATDFKDKNAERDVAEPSNFFFANNLETLKFNQKNALPNIEMKSQPEKKDSEEKQPNEIHYNFMEEIRRKSLTKEIKFTSEDVENSDNFFNPIKMESRTEEIDDENQKESQQRQPYTQQQLQIWVTSSSPQSVESTMEQPITSPTIEPQPTSAKSKKSNLMLQLFGNTDDNNIESLTDYTLPLKPEFDLSSRLDSGIRSSSDSGFLLPRRPREKSNILPKQMMSPIPGVIEDETSPLLL